MKYIKTFENLDNVEYSVGDIVTLDIKKSGGPFFKTLTFTSFILIFYHFFNIL